MMNIRMKSLLVTASSFIMMQVSGQGTLTGTILDEISGEALPGVNITNQEKNRAGAC